MFSWSSIHTAGSMADVWDVKFPILAISATMLRRKATRIQFYDQIAKFFAWEVSVLMGGTLPEFGFLDSELPRDSYWFR